METNVTAYVPCYNNEATIKDAIRSVSRQTLPVQRIIVVDDGSTDGSCAQAEELGIETIRIGSNKGRGNARATAMEALESDYVLSIDATAILAEDFLETALEELQTSPKAACVFGNIHQKAAGNASDRWRDRHLFAPARVQESKETRSFHTTGALVKRAPVMEAGNYDRSLRHSEDAALGERLWELGYSSVASARCLLYANISNSASKVMERYWRWNVGKDERFGCRKYLSSIVYSLKVMAMKDLRDKDWAGAAISLSMPHYQLWKALVGPQNK